MRQKVLFSATLLSHIQAFHMPYLEFFKNNGFEVHVAAKQNIESRIDGIVDRFYDLPFERSPLKWANIAVYRRLKTIIDENDYDIIHLHTPVAGVLGRLAAIKTRKRGTKVIYTAHGFHFYQGAPLKNWLLYYPIEKYMARHCDCLITITEEDYSMARKGNFKAGMTAHVHGVGVDLKKYTPADEDKLARLRQKHGYRMDDFLLIYPAGLEPNKNQSLLIRGMPQLKHKIPNIKLLLCGFDSWNGHLQQLAAQYGVSDCVLFLGRRDDVEELISMSDCSVASSFREGLPRNVMEAMATGKPVAASRNRGHAELIRHGENGLLFCPYNETQFIEYITMLYESMGLRESYAQTNLEVVKRYSLDKVMAEMQSIYGKLLWDNEFQRLPVQQIHAREGRLL